MRLASYALIGAFLLGCWGGPAEAQTYIGGTCTVSWKPNVETDLAGYRVWAVEGATSRPIVTLSKTATSHPTSVSCTALGMTGDGPKRVNVVAFDNAGNASSPAVIDAVRDTMPPASPSGLEITSPQPIAMSVTPNPSAKQATVAWVPGTCQQEFIVSRLVSGRWIEIGRTHDPWLAVPLVNQVSQPYGVSAVCG